MEYDPTAIEPEEEKTDQEVFDQEQQAAKPQEVAPDPEQEAPPVSDQPTSPPEEE